MTYYLILQEEDFQELTQLLKHREFKKKLRHFIVKRKKPKQVAIFSLIWYTGYCSYTSFVFGHFLSKRLKKLIKFLQSMKEFDLKEFDFENVIEFFSKLIEDQRLEISKKHQDLIEGFKISWRAFKTFLKKFLKSPFKFQKNYNRFVDLLKVLIENFETFSLLMNALFFINNFVNYIIKSRNDIFLIKKSIYRLYLIYISLVGLLVGFLVGLFCPKFNINHTYSLLFGFFLEVISWEEIIYWDWDELDFARLAALCRRLGYRLWLRFWRQLWLWRRFFQIIYWKKKLNETSNLSYSSLAANKGENFSFQPLPQAESRPSKLIFKETLKRSQIPVPILEDPSVNIDVQLHYIYDQFIYYEIELFEFYETFNFGENINI